MRVPASTELEVGRLGRMTLDSAFYVYVGSALGPGGVGARLGRHLGPVRRRHWHIDHLRARARLVQALPIRTADDLECELAESLSPICDWSHRGFGCSDCDCDSHLFGFAADREFEAVIGAVHRPIVPEAYAVMIGLVLILAAAGLAYDALHERDPLPNATPRAEWFRTAAAIATPGSAAPTSSRAIA